MPKIIFVTGGVVSSLGKGIVASITGGLLKARGIKVKIKKIDPYLNVDPGTLSPSEHGEVFVTEDGAETDLDLGHYERLGGVKTEKTDYLTSGLIYNTIIQKERKGDYLGQTVMVIPHVIAEFEKAILANTQDCDVLICEVGGTVGDIEGIPILETARQMRQNAGANDVVFVHVALLPYLKKAQEWKTKPIQHSVRTLLSFGIQPDLLLCRMEEKNEENWKEKIALLCNIRKDNILSALDAPSIYHAMLNYEAEGVANRISDLLNIDTKPGDITYVRKFVERLDAPLQEINIAIVGKYTLNKDSYKSLEEALVHAAVSIDRHIKIDWVDAEKVGDLSQYDGILVPGGFGERGTMGMLTAIKFARANNVPFLGICFGMQLVVIDGLSDVLDDVCSSEFRYCANPVIAKMEEWIQNDAQIKASINMGGSMRLGSYPCEIKKDTLAYKIYKTERINERHRHRYEFNNNYLKYLEKANIVASGTCNELVEIIERTDCDFFIACQFHPEFKSTISSAHPLFMEFLKSSSQHKKKV